MSLAKRMVFPSEEDCVLRKQQQPRLMQANVVQRMAGISQPAVLIEGARSYRTLPWNRECP